jgi:hypothetical protein
MPNGFASRCEVKIDPTYRLRLLPLLRPCTPCSKPRPNAQSSTSNRTLQYTGDMSAQRFLRPGVYGF